MQRSQTIRSSIHPRNAALLAGIRVARLDASTLRQFLCDLANCRDEKLDALRNKYKTMLTRQYAASELASYRDELRLLWHPVHGIPHDDFEAFEQWRKIRPTAKPGEMICNRWLDRSETGLLVVWEKGWRELWPSANDLPAILVYGCLLFGDHLRYCLNSKCGAPWFIGTRRGQKYCSNDCAWPAKKAAKLKWWKENRAKNSPMLSRRTRR